LVFYCDKAVLNQVAPLLIKMLQALICNLSCKTTKDYLWYLCVSVSVYEAMNGSCFQFPPSGPSFVLRMDVF